MPSATMPVRTCSNPGIPHLMWIFLNNAFVSIVNDKDNPDNLIVRARHHGDIRRVFPRAKVVITPEADYRYRACLPRTLVAEKIASQIAGIDLYELQRQRD
jgi:hypothetical protein